jgi:hypothetical protein
MLTRSAGAGQDGFDDSDTLACAVTLVSRILTPADQRQDVPGGSRPGLASEEKRLLLAALCCATRGPETRRRIWMIPRP